LSCSGLSEEGLMERTQALYSRSGTCGVVQENWSGSVNAGLLQSTEDPPRARGGLLGAVVKLLEVGVM
jgi:hypothetical protein